MIFKLLIDFCLLVCSYGNVLLDSFLILSITHIIATIYNDTLQRFGRLLKNTIDATVK